MLIFSVRMAVHKRVHLASEATFNNAVVNATKDVTE